MTHIGRRFGLFAVICVAALAAATCYVVYVQRAVPPLKAVETFVPIDAKKIACMTPVLAASNSAVKNGGYAVKGYIEGLRCHAPPKSADVEIPLKSKNFDNGLIKTKDFGDIKIAVTSYANAELNFVGGTNMPLMDPQSSLEVSMKPSDEARLEAYLKEH